jgi:hypothetical protein
MLVSLMDELEKIGANVALANLSMPSAAKPAPLVRGSGVTTALKPNTKPTNYSTMHTQTPPSAVGTADSSKSAAPPAVRS